MPLIGTGDQGWPAEQMLRATLRSAVYWMERGLSLRLLKIVVYQKDTAQDMAKAFASYKEECRVASMHANMKVSAPDRLSYDLFLSYSHKDSEIANYFVETLRSSSRRPLTIFHDKISLRDGETWLMAVASALDTSRRVVALYSNNYWSSRNCTTEFCGAFMRQGATGQELLFPIYISDAAIPYMFQVVQYADCRVNDRAKIVAACSRLATALH